MTFGCRRLRSRHAHCLLRRCRPQSRPANVHMRGAQMIMKQNWKMLAAAVLGSLALSAGAADNGDTNKSGMYESGDRGVKAPGSAGDDAEKRESKAGTGVSTMPARNNPASVSESAPQKTGKEVSTPPVADNKKIPNPKVPASVNESAPQKT